MIIYNIDECLCRSSLANRMMVSSTMNGDSNIQWKKNRGLGTQAHRIVSISRNGVWIGSKLSDLMHDVFLLI